MIKCFAIYLLVLATSTKVGRALSSFQYTSSPESWVGRGLSIDAMDGENGYILFQPNPGYSGGNLVVISLVVERFLNPLDINPVESYRIALRPPLHESLSPGFYDNIVKDPARDNLFGMGGFELASVYYGDGRGNQDVGGWFNLLELVFDSKGQVANLAFDFLQLDEGKPQWWTKGSYRYNSDVPVSMADSPPGLACTLAAFAACLASGRLKRGGPASI